jgi:diacylglycerol kinase (ATP)
MATTLGGNPSPPIKGEVDNEAAEKETFSLDPQNKRTAFFVFVNPTSGGNKAAAFTKLSAEKMIFPELGPKHVHVELSIYSLKDPKSKNRGLDILKTFQHDKKYEIRIIVGGGDGTIMWVIEEMIKAGISFSKTSIGCVPFGTGNDFARVMGWGGQEPSTLIGIHLDALKGLMLQWLDATIEDFDIWDINVETNEEGGIRRIEKEQGKKFQKKFLTEKDPVLGEEKRALTLKKKMCNYYSFGIDGRIGYGFDKSRTTSRSFNKMVYCWEGFKKIFIKTFKTNHILHRVETYQVPDNKEQPAEEQNLKKIEYKGGNDFLLYPSANKDEKAPHASIIKGDPSVFLCLNVPSYMGGASSPWSAAKGKVGALDHQKKLLQDFGDQKTGDGKLEIISFSGPVSLAMERFFKGQGRRVGQTSGPFAINFNKSQDEKKPITTYIQIDGEFFQLVSPKVVRLELTKDIPNGKIRVLRKAVKGKK